MSERDAVYARCTRFFANRRPDMRESLERLAREAQPGERPDRYGGGEMLAAFEREMAELLGKPAAVFMPSGTMAQAIALRVHAERRSCRTVAIHEQSHLIVSENDAMRRLHGLNPVFVGERDRLFTRADVEALREPVAALLIELPERNLGGALRTWDELRSITAAARSAGAAVHLDGARLWESQPFYGRSFAEICALFDTVYVSFYKVLGAVAGALLAGPQEIVDEARGWQWRQGGRLVQQYPMALSARAGVRDVLPEVPRYVERAQRAAAALRGLPGVRVVPDPPPTNMFRLYAPGADADIEAAALRLSAETRVWMPPVWNAADVPGYAWTELTFEGASFDLDEREIVDLFARLLG